LKIELSNEQYRELVINTAIGAWVRESVLEGRDEAEAQEEATNLQEYLLTFADQFACGDMVEKFDDILVLKEEIEQDEVISFLEDFVEDELFSSLALKLGSRDCTKDLTEEQMNKSLDSGKMPKGFDKAVEKYENEFIEHGIDRLQIVE